MASQQMKTTLLALGATALFGVTAAQAATITLPSQTLGSSTVQGDGATNWTSNSNFTDGFHLDAGSSPTIRGPMSFAQFDDMGGTRILNSVTVNISGRWEGTLNVSNGTGSGEATVTRADLLVRFAVDVFNDFTGNAFSDSDLIEISGFTGFSGIIDVNYDSDFDTFDSWDETPPGTPTFSLPEGTSYSDTSLAGSFSDQVVLTSALDDFIGTGNFPVGCLARSDDDLQASGGDTSRGHNARAECTVGISYEWSNAPTDNPVPAPIALVALGLMGLVGLRRMRR
jgi:hypothetical protein